MAEENKNLDKKVDELEAAAKKYASKDTVIAIGGYEFTPAKLMIAFTLVSSILGGLYGTFEVYKDYQSMKKKIAEYISPDLTEVYKKLAVIEENTQKTSDYTRDIKGDLKNDIRRLEGVVENVERSAKQTSRETDQAVKEARDEVRQVRKEAENTAKALERDMASATKALNNEVDRKIQRALDNPLAK
jgi:methyl-accepting chemotaxis protein